MDQKVVNVFEVLQENKIIPDLRELYKDYSLQQFMHKRHMYS